MKKLIRILLKGGVSNPLDDEVEYTEEVNIPIVLKVSEWKPKKQEPIIGPYIDPEDLIKPNKKIVNSGEYRWISNWLNKRADILSDNETETYPDRFKPDDRISNGNKILSGLLRNLGRYNELQVLSIDHSGSNARNETGDATGMTDRNKKVITYRGYPSYLTKIHEFTHGMSDGYSPLINKIMRLMKLSNFDIRRSGVNSSSYRDNPDEIYSRLMELRAKHNLDPNKKYTIDEINRMYSPYGSYWDNFDIFNRYKPEFIEKLFNEVADNGRRESDVLFALNGTQLGSAKINKNDVGENRFLKLWYTHPNRLKIAGLNAVDTNYVPFSQPSDRFVNEEETYKDNLNDDELTQIGAGVVDDMFTKLGTYKEHYLTKQQLKEERDRQRRSGVQFNSGGDYAYGWTDPSSNEIYYEKNRYTNLVNPSVIIHERSHALTSPTSLPGSDIWQNSSPQIRKVGWFRQYHLNNGGYLNRGINQDRYLDNMSEIYARRNQAIWNNKLKPGKKYTSKDVDAIRRKVYLGKIPDDNFWKRYNNKFILDLLNNVASYKHNNISEEENMLV